MLSFSMLGIGIAWDGIIDYLFNQYVQWIMYPYVVITIYVRTDGWLIIRLEKITGEFGDFFQT